jgi:hypothetical protein
MAVVIFALAFRTLGIRNDNGPWVSVKNKQTMLESEKGVARMEMAREVITLQRNIGKSEGKEINLQHEIPLSRFFSGFVFRLLRIKKIKHRNFCHGTTMAIQPEQRVRFYRLGNSEWLFGISRRR